MTLARAAGVTVLVVWAIAWVGVGVSVAREVRDLASLSDTVVSLGQATESAADSLGVVETLPVVGQDVGDVAAEVRRAGEAAVQSGRESRESARRLGTLLGVSIAVIPTVAGLALFVAVSGRASRSPERVRR